jgi:hypothetical protein
MKIILFRCALIVTGLLPAITWAIDERNAFTTGLVAGGPVLHSGAVIEYERRFKGSLSLGLQAGSLSYNYKDDDFREKGKRTGANLILRFSPGRQGYQGFYLGGGLGYWSGFYDYVDPQDNPASGHIKTPSIFLLATTGWRIPLGDSQFYLDPRLSWGTILKSGGDHKPTSNEEDNSVFRNFLNLGLNVGVRF